ncbi:hypothetical protein VTN00DRAFT_1753 [Thermoascus crustaceus]|uniref:uncharacterized protein n=1 Tax=Thermoascus crustaceus TaxID=5088 RepID=UPI0037442DD4
MIISLFEIPLIIVSATRTPWSRWSSDGLASVRDPSSSANIPTILGDTNHPWIGMAMEMGTFANVFRLLLLIISHGQITPSNHLSYTPCFEHFECARLEVRIDWNSTDKEGEKVAHDSQTACCRAGDGPKVLIPVESTTPLLDTSALQTLIHGHVGHWTTTFMIFQEAQSGYRESLNQGMALAGTCTQEGGPEIGEFMNTTPTVADMIAIIERHGEWREKEARSILESKKCLPVPERQAILDATQWKRGKEPLQYWGFSDGAVLGATFAAMHPHRAQRMVLDKIATRERSTLVSGT